MVPLSQAPFELAIFDVDGTLNRVEAWWPDLIREGVALFSAQAGLELETPDDARALAVVGNKDEEVWGPFLPPECRQRWGDLRDLVLPMEVALLRSGVDYLYVGVDETLGALRDAGVRLALASNCGAAYMAAIAEGQGLGARTDWQFCLDSDGVRTKADMLRQAMRQADTQRAVMIGDRASDQQAARQAGLPFIWRTNDLCDLSDAEGCWDGAPAQLLGLLGL